MRQRLLFALGFAISGFLASAGSAFAAFDPGREELMGIMAGVIGVLLALLTLIYAVKWYFGWDQQPPTDLPDPHAGHD